MAPSSSIGQRPASQRAEWIRFRRRTLPLLIEAQGGLCAICGGALDHGADGRRGDGPQIDHVNPLADGAPLIPASLDDVRAVHARCNQVRGHRTRQRRGRIARDQKDLLAITDDARVIANDPTDRDDGQSRIFFETRGDYRREIAKYPGKYGESTGTGDDFTDPRLVTPTPADVTGSYGPAAAAWAVDHLETTLLPWQDWALGRILEHRSDGSLRWRIVVLTVARQSGKSYLGRVGCGWRAAAGHDVFGERQLVLSTANKQVTAREIWQEAAYTLIAHDPSARIRMALGSEEIRFLDSGGRWIVQAATPNLAVGLSVSHALCDEAWNVDRIAVESGLVPTMLQRRSPQLWIVSTAGDSGSDLLETYRAAALRQLDDPESAEILLLEWSAEPDADIDDRDAWRAASPHWTPERERYLELQLDVLPEQTFRTQMLNQKVDALGGWLSRQAWDRCRSPIELQHGGARVYAAIEYAQDGETFAVVIGQRVGESIVIRSQTFRSLDDLWRRVCELPRDALLLQSIGFKDKLPLAPCETRPVGIAQLRLATRYAGRAITDGVVAHDGDPELTQHVLSAVVAYSESGPVLSMSRSPAPITLARAMVWVLGAILEPETAGRPMVVARSG